MARHNPVPSHPADGFLVLVSLVVVASADGHVLQEASLLHLSPVVLDRRFLVVLVSQLLGASALAAPFHGRLLRIEPGLVEDERFECSFELHGGEGNVVDIISTLDEFGPVGAARGRQPLAVDEPAQLLLDAEQVRRQRLQRIALLQVPLFPMLLLT